MVFGGDSIGSLSLRQLQRLKIKKNDGTESNTEIFSSVHIGRNFFFFFNRIGLYQYSVSEDIFLLLLHILKSGSPQTLSRSIFEKGARLDILLTHEFF